VSKIIPVHVILYNSQDVNTIYGLNSNRIFDNITPHKEGAIILYKVDTLQGRRDTLLISDSPVEIYRAMDVPINPASVTLSLVGSGNVSVSIDDVVYCYADAGNFGQSYVRVFTNSVDKSYHIDMSLLELIETLNEPDEYTTRYTDSEAQAACGLNGTLYLTIAGLAFTTINPDVDDVIKQNGYIQASANGIILQGGISLPNGATITGAKVYGNAASQDDTWYLRYTALSNGSYTTMATAVIGTEDTSITNPVIDNTLYGYYFTTTALDIGDRIYGARISYTL